MSDSLSPEDIRKIYDDLFKVGREMLADEHYYDGIQYFRDAVLEKMAQRR